MITEITVAHRAVTEMIIEIIAADRTETLVKETMTTEIIVADRAASIRMALTRTDVILALILTVS